MKKILCLIVSLAIWGISGCDVFLGPDAPVGMGTLSIGFGEDGGARSVSDDILATLRYDLVLTGPDSQKITASLADGHTFNEQVALGEWLIEANAFTPEETLFGAGSTTITVRAGANQVRVPMTRVSGEEDTPVSALDLTALVVAPERGATPNTTAIDEAQYTGTIAWQNEAGTNVTGNFAPSTIYQAVVSLTTKTGYTFTGVGANSFIYTYTGAAATNPAGSGNAIAVTIVFPETAAPGVSMVSDLDLTALVIAPERGATPNTTAIDEAQYTGTIAWQNADGTNVTGNFAPSTIYQAVISLTAKPGYTFGGLGANSFIYTYTGATTTNPAGSGGAITVTISFPETAPPGENTVSDLDLTDLVAAPVKDETPVTTINESQYTGVITWTPADSTFAPSTVYEAEVVLTAKSGFTFTGVNANSFTHTYAGATATNPAGSGNTITVTISFPETAANVVSDLDLTTFVTAPVKHMEPGTTINESQYTGVITWTPADSTFAPSTIYEAEVVLTAKSGFTFTGVVANSFSHSGAITITNAAGSGNAITVEISFPATVANVASAFDLTALVAAPAKGATPNTTPISVAQYTGTITWAPADSTFAPSTVYEAEVVLTAKSGFTFTGVNANSFAHTYAGATATNPVGSGNTITVTITFPVTAADVVSAFDLTALVAAPAKGATPNTTPISVAQYTGTVTWKKADGTIVTGNFASATIYQATVSLTVKIGYTFTGVNADSFTHDDAAVITNAAGSGDTMTITVVFPVTGDQAITLVFTDDGDGAFSQENFAISQSLSESQTVTSPGSDYTNHRWFVDGDLKGTTDTIAIDAVDYSVGKHNLTLLISKGGISWSKEMSFTVTN